MRITDLKYPAVINVLDKNLFPVGVVKSYTTLVIAPSLAGVGRFEFTTMYDDAVKDLLVDDMIVEFASGGIYAGIIRGTMKDLAPNGTTIRVFGTMLDGLVRRRLGVPPDDPALLGWDVASGTVGSIMAHYVTNHMISPTVSARAIPLVTLMSGIESIGMETVAKARYDNLDSLFTSLTQFSSTGWRFVIANGKYEFQAIPPNDRTQVSDDPLVLSPVYQNVSKAQYTTDKTDYANTVYALGEGEYENRLYQVYYGGDATISGFDRIETVADCGNEDSVTRLKDISLQKIAELEKYDSLTLEALPNNVSADLGDVVTVHLPKINVYIDLQIVEAAITWSGATKTVDLVLGKPPRTFSSDQINRARRLQNIT